MRDAGAPARLPFDASDKRPDASARQLSAGHQGCGSPQGRQVRLEALRRSIDAQIGTVTPPSSAATTAHSDRLAGLRSAVDAEVNRAEAVDCREPAR